MSGQISAVLGGAGFAVGLIIALGVLSGDEQGRVNLLYLLVLFVFFPLAGLAFSAIFMLRGSGRGLSGLLLSLPLVPPHWNRQIMVAVASPARKYWFFYQTQILAVGFGAGGIVAFIFLLLGSDVSFVWRSTLLDAEDILPLLNSLALPWWFWQGAQPSLELLQQTQDYRLAPQEYTAEILGRWWQYALAAQLFYNLAPRLLLLVAARSIYLRKESVQEAAPKIERSVGNGMNPVPDEGKLAEVVHNVEEKFRLINWAAVPPDCLEQIQHKIGSPQQVVMVRPAAAPEEDDSLRSGPQPVVLVKSWEPPMGELRDFLEKGAGLIFPLDWDNGTVRPVRDAHLHEWRRFCGTLDSWRVLQPVEAA
ncbi:MAG: DUF2868 domain-containing protein [Pseudohongiellaceae bacterium]